VRILLLPYIDDPNFPPPDRRLEMIQIAEQAIRICDRLLAENAELKRCLATTGKTPRGALAKRLVSKVVSK
jgi:hypothetical protein